MPGVQKQTLKKCPFWGACSSNRPLKTIFFSNLSLRPLWWIWFMLACEARWKGVFWRLGGRSFLVEAKPSGWSWMNSVLLTWRWKPDGWWKPGHGGKGLLESRTLGVIQCRSLSFLCVGAWMRTAVRKSCVRAWMGSVCVDAACMVHVYLVLHEAPLH